ncbi:MAG TPA: hypothetical protein V6C81_26055 [Planktothrix sp.]
MLQGRIEQISGQNEPRLPDLKALTPKMDTRGTTEKKTAASAGSYPINWQGTWAGELRIANARYAEPTVPALKQEISLERRLNAPGRIGRAAFSFANAAGNKISLDPVTIEFNYPSDMALPPPVKITEENASRLLPPGQTMEPGMTIVPQRTYVLSMNSCTGGITSGGNIATQQLMLNSIKALAKNVLEQDIVTYGSEELQASGAKVYEYDEDVLRFTMVNDRTMLVQAVTLCYDNRGRCSSTVSFSGYIYRKG